MGMAIRASGAGMNVYILQFVKAKGASVDKIKDGEWPVSSEIEFFNFLNHKLGSAWGTKVNLSLPPSFAEATGDRSGTLPKLGEGKMGLIANEQLGLGFVGILGDKKQKAIHIKAAIDGLSRAREIITSGEYQVIILDEIISALESQLIEERDIIDLIKAKHPLQHIVLTGHNKYPKILKHCDLVTEMKMLKHPYYKGVLAQRGIDY
jgi:cob(I)alamin adenosyltransferase